MQPLVGGAGRLSQERKAGRGRSSTKERGGATTLPTTILSHYSGVYHRQKCHLIGKRLSKQTTFTAKDTSAGLFIGVIQQDGAYYGIKISAYWETWVMCKKDSIHDSVAVRVDKMTASWGILQK